VQLPESVNHTSDLSWETQVTSQGRNPLLSSTATDTGRKKRKDGIYAPDDSLDGTHI